MGRRRPSGGRLSRFPFTRRSRLDQQRLDLLVKHPRVRDAARIGRIFRLDPVALLEESDPLRVLIRVAAARVCNDDEEAASTTKRGMSAADVAGLPDEDD